MTGRPCPVCGQPSGDDQATICRDCWRRTTTVLTELPELIDDLETTITRQSTLPSSSPGGGSRVDYDPVAGQLRDTIRGQLASWCRLLHDDHHTPLPADTIPAMADTIRRSRLRHHQAAGDACHEITAWPHQIAQAIDWPAERHVTRVARCVRSGDGWQCDGWIHVHHPTVGAPYAACHSCQTVWQTEQQIGELGDAIRARSAMLRLLAAIRAA